MRVAYKSRSSTMANLSLIFSLIAVFVCRKVISLPTSGGVKLRAAPASTAIPNQYIVTFKNATRDTVITNKAGQWAARRLGKVRHVFTAAINGLSISNVSEIHLQEILNDTDVVLVEQDQLASANAIQMNPGNWGLDRIDQPSLPLNNKYRYGYTGRGVQVFILDSGIRTTHVEFANGRATCAKNFVTSEPCSDLYGHGTHVAGVVGGKSAGVAKQVSLLAVKVLDKTGSGLFSDVIAGLNWVQQQQKSGRQSQRMVVNMSLGGGTSTSVNNAVDSLVSAGIFVAVAAGNDSFNACNKSPASASLAVTVASTDNTDTRSGFSNYGSCVDVFAPGSGILSSFYTSDTATKIMSGTSMASPHVAGVAALYLEARPLWGPKEVWNAINSDTILGRISSLQGSPNKLVSVMDINALFPTPAPTATRRPSHRPSYQPSPSPTNTVSPSVIPSASHKPSLSAEPTQEPCHIALLGRCTDDRECCSGRCLRYGRCGFLPSHRDI